MCDWECGTWDPAVSSSFDCLLRHRSTYNVISWYDPCARCNQILMFLTTKWKWKWLKFSGGPPTPQAHHLGGGGLPPNPLSVAPRKHIVALNKLGQERLRDPWLKGLVGQLASIQQERQKLYSGQMNKNKFNSCGSSLQCSCCHFQLFSPDAGTERSCNDAHSQQWTRTVNVEGGLWAFPAYLVLRCVFWVPHWGGWGATPPPLEDGGPGGWEASQKISATFTFIWWSKTSKFGCIWHRGHIN